MVKLLSLLLSLMLLFCCSSSIYAHPIHFVGVGRDCQAAEALKAFKLRKASYPFDWFVSKDFNMVTLAIEKDFEFFLDPAYLLNVKQSYVENTYYHFYYNHFFPVVNWILVSNWLDYLPEVQTTQYRRIARFQDLLNSQNTIVFIRTHCSSTEAESFVKMIKIKYPTLDFVLAVVNEGSDVKDDWQIPHVLNFYASKKIGLVDWWALSEWESIFAQIKHWLASTHSCELEF